MRKSTLTVSLLGLVKLHWNIVGMGSLMVPTLFLVGIALNI